MKLRSKRIRDIPEVAKAAASLVAGGAIGYGIVSISGMSAVGMVGGGAGVGMSAGPVGTVVGAIAGLALFGACRAIKGR